MNPKLREFLESDLLVWWASETDEFRRLVFRLLAALPGGNVAQDMIDDEPLPVGWKEVGLLGQLLTLLEDASDVRGAVEAIIAQEDPYNVAAPA